MEVILFASMSAVDSPHSKVQGSGFDEPQTMQDEQNNFYSTCSACTIHQKLVQTDENKWHVSIDVNGRTFNSLSTDKKLSDIKLMQL